LPTQLSALDAQQIDSIACGADHTLAYSESRNELYSWGWSDCNSSLLLLRFDILTNALFLASLLFLIMGSSLFIYGCDVVLVSASNGFT